MVAAVLLVQVNALLQFLALELFTTSLTSTGDHHIDIIQSFKKLALVLMNSAVKLHKMILIIAHLVLVLLIAMLRDLAVALKHLTMVQRRNE